MTKYIVYWHENINTLVADIIISHQSSRKLLKAALYLVSVAVIVDQVVCLLSHCPVEQPVVVSRSLLTHNLQCGLVVPEKGEHMCISQNSHL